MNIESLNYEQVHAIVSLIKVFLVGINIKSKFDKNFFKWKAIQILTF